MATTTTPRLFMTGILNCRQQTPLSQLLFTDLQQLTILALVIGYVILRFFQRIEYNIHIACTIYDSIVRDLLFSILYVIATASAQLSN
jgi:hypothetical protein